MHPQDTLKTIPIISDNWRTFTDHKKCLFYELKQNISQY